MRKAMQTLASVLLLAFLAGCSLSHMEPRKFAIVFGINTYPGNNLTYPVDDATSVAAMFTANGFSSGDVIIRTEAAATKATLKSDLDSLAAQMGPDDLFVFYYSGHGGQFGPQDAVREWIFPSGSIDGSFNIVFADSIYDSELGTMLDVLPTKRRVVILDSCNSGGFLGSGLEADTVPPELYQHTTLAGKVTSATIIQAIRNYAAFSSVGTGGISPYKALVIAAAGADEFSWEAGGMYNHGIATYYLLQAPASGDLNGDGVVTVLETFALMKAGIDQTWNTRYANNIFSPHVSGGPIDLSLF